MGSSASRAQPVEGDCFASASNGSPPFCCRRATATVRSSQELIWETGVRSRSGSVYIAIVRRAETCTANTLGRRMRPTSSSCSQDSLSSSSSLIAEDAHWMTKAKEGASLSKELSQPSFSSI
eukprot:7279448-Prymnesium_polylepis.1